MKTWAFIYKTQGASPDVHKADLKSETRRSLIYGVSSIEEGAALAKRLMLEDDCKLIELCGGFGVDGTKKVIAAVEGKIPVGYIDYFPEERKKLSIMKD